MADGSEDTPLLFTDGLPDEDESVGYPAQVAARVVGITYRQIDYWARTALVEPTVRGAAGSGSQRLYGFRDIILLKTVKGLLDLGVQLQQVRKAIEQLRKLGFNDLSRVTLISDGASVYLPTSNEEAMDLLLGGQGVFGIAVGPVFREVESSLTDIDAIKGDDPIDELARRRAQRAAS